MKTTRPHFRLFMAAGIICALSTGFPALAKDSSKSSARPQFGDWGVDLTGMDKSVKPGDDFYSYVNGKWHANAKIPSDKKQVGPAASLQDIAFDQVKVLLDEAAADTKAPKGSDRQKIGDWYASLMDEKNLASIGLTPIRPDLEHIREIKDRTALADMLAENLSGLGTSPLRVGWDFDRKRVNKTLVSLSTGGLSLPARELYLEAGAAPIRKLYLKHIARVFKLAGLSEGEKRAERVLGLETRIEEFTWPLAEKRDPRKQFNPTPAKNLPKLAPGIDWVRFLNRAGVGAPEIVIENPTSVLFHLTLNRFIKL